mmetsp:Transcript_540/g.2053  ORF Transcript_540/g.2053 Transcript_540/m.2053 type:complete len:225 (+) Transcript_540:477-1151(+)
MFHSKIDRSRRVHQPDEVRVGKPEPAQHGPAAGPSRRPGGIPEHVQRTTRARPERVLDPVALAVPVKVRRRRRAHLPLPHAPRRLARHPRVAPVPRVQRRDLRRLDLLPPRRSRRSQRRRRRLPSLAPRLDFRGSLAATALNRVDAPFGGGSSRAPGAGDGVRDEGDVHATHAAPERRGYVEPFFETLPDVVGGGDRRRRRRGRLRNARLVVVVKIVVVIITTE